MVSGQQCFFLNYCFKSVWYHFWSPISKLRLNYRNLPRLWGWAHSVEQGCQTCGTLTALILPAVVSKMDNMIFYVKCTYLYICAVFDIIWLYNANLLLIQNNLFKSLWPLEPCFTYVARVEFFHIKFDFLVDLSLRPLVYNFTTFYKQITKSQTRQSGQAAFCAFGICVRKSWA